MSATTCLVCGKHPAAGEDDVAEDDNGGVALECEKCEAPYHLKCLDPPLDDVPEGEWFCVTCEREEADDQVGIALGGGPDAEVDDAVPVEAEDPSMGEAGTDVPDEPDVKKGRGASRGPSKSATPRRSETPAKTLKRKPTSGSLNGTHRSTCSLA